MPLERSKINLCLTLGVIVFPLLLRRQSIPIGNSGNRRQAQTIPDYNFIRYSNGEIEIYLMDISTSLPQLV